MAKPSGSKIAAKAHRNLAAISCGFDRAIIEAGLVCAKNASSNFSGRLLIQRVSAEAAWRRLGKTDSKIDEALAGR